MNNDDNIDEIIRNAASDYNRPPATPRDEMWTAIQAAESAQSGPRLHVTAGGGYSASHKSAPKYAWFGLAAAAVLLVATGVGIGRWTGSAKQSERQVADAPSLTARVVTGDGIVAPDNRDTPPAANSVNTSEPSTGSTQRNETPRPTTTRTRDDIRRNPVVIGSGELRRRAGEAGSGHRATGIGQLASGNGSVQAVSYQVATQQHLQDAEALLTSFSADSRDERMNSQFAGWAKGLLSNTRLLLDSPAGDDPRRARLLQDLEMVLAQIVQLSPDAQATDRELIQGSIQNGLVMTRLRSAIPADQPREITER